MVPDCLSLFSHPDCFIPIQIALPDFGLRQEWHPPGRGFPFPIRDCAPLIYVITPYT
jgi:hypothetical protein